MCWGAMIRNSLGKLKADRLEEKTEVRTLTFVLRSRIECFSKSLQLSLQIMSPNTFYPAICSKPTPLFKYSDAYTLFYFIYLFIYF